METTNVKIAVLTMNTRNGGFEYEDIDSEEKSNRMNQTAETRKDEWDYAFGLMSPLNIDLATIVMPAYEFRFKLDCRKFKFAIFTHPQIINFASRVGRLNNSIFQLFCGNKSLIIGVKFHPMCDRMWDEKKIELSDWEKTLTSMALNAQEGDGPFFVAMDVLHSIAKQDKSKNFTNVFQVLN